MLGERERRLYARHILLPEIGMAGQERLCHASVAPAQHADPEAEAWARTYLGRAGLQVADAPVEPGASPLAVATPAEVDAIAGDPALRHAAAALSGCLAAVETIKGVLEVGTPAELGASTKLAENDALPSPARPGQDDSDKETR